LFCILPFPYKNILLKLRWPKSKFKPNETSDEIYLLYDFSLTKHTLPKKGLFRGYKFHRSIIIRWLGRV
jgi:hypothetical protein